MYGLSTARAGLVRALRRHGRGVTRVGRRGRLALELIQHLVDHLPPSDNRFVLREIFHKLEAVIVALGAAVARQELGRHPALRV